MTHIFLKQLLDSMQDGTWVRVKVQGTNTYFFGHTGPTTTRELLDLVYERTNATILEVFEFSRMEGFEHGVAVYCVPW